MRTFGLLIGLLTLSPAFATEALAKPTSSQVEQAKQTLAGIAQHEEEVMQGIMDALDTMQPLPVSDEAKADYDSAKSLHAEAKTLWQNKQYRDAYMKFRESADKLEPALAEVLALPDTPKNVQDAAGALVSMNAQAVDQLAQAVAQYASPEAKSSYSQAKSLYAEAKSMWDAGQRRDACDKSWASLKELDVAVREMWQANAPAAKQQRAG